MKKENMTPSSINKAIGNMDLYLLDQLLKGQIPVEGKILDAGCGEGRNLKYFIDHGYDVYGVDSDALAIQMVQMMSKELVKERFQVTTIEEMIFPPNAFKYIICNAVLHFAKNEEHFNAMLQKMVEATQGGGRLFVQTAIATTEEEAGLQTLTTNAQRYVLATSAVEDICNTLKLKLVEPLRIIDNGQEYKLGVLILEKL